MHEEQTFEAIMARCLGRVSATVDKREGSIIYDALAPACVELALLYIEMSNMMDRAFPDTATGEDLERKAMERSIQREAATSALRRGQFTDANGAAFAVPPGTRFSGGQLNYVVSGYIAPGAYSMACETTGEAGNLWFGTLLPIDYIDGLAGAELLEVLIPGEDTEDDARLRDRYFNSFDSQAFGGNIANYRERIGALAGVGGVKVTRTPDGGGTVGVTLVASDWAIPTQALIEAVQTAVDPTQNQGAGVGLAPIGHTVAVGGATGRPVDVVLKLTLDSNVRWEHVRVSAVAVIQEYFRELIQRWENTVALTVRISQIETRVLEITGVLDVEGTTLNGVAKNLELTAAEIPVLSGVANGAD